MLKTNFACCVFFPSWRSCWSCNLSGLPTRRRQVLPTLASLYGPEAVAEAEKSTAIAQVGNWEKCWEIEVWGGKLMFYGGGSWKMGNDVKILVVKDSTSNWRWKWWRFGRLVAGRMEILMDGAFLLHHQAWSKLGSESVSRKSVDVSRLPGPWQASKPRCSMPTRLGKADLDGLGITALNWQRTQGFVTCKVMVLKLS